MSLISGFNPTGAVQGGVAGGQAGGWYGAIAGGVLGGFLGGGGGTGYKDPKVSMHGYGFQAAGIPYAQAQALKKAGITSLPTSSGPMRYPMATSLVGTNYMAPSVQGSLLGTGAATMANSLSASSLNPLGQVLAGAGAAAWNALAPSPAQTAANNATAIYRMLTGQSGGAVKKRRRMNPMNIRAARRAIRRIRSARKVLMRIERSLPKARTHHRSPRR